MGARQDRADHDLSTEPGPVFEVVGSADPPAVVLVHGAPDRAASFRSVLPHLAAHQVVLYDRRGYGRSGDLSPPTDLIDHAEDLISVIERVDQPCVAVAHSFGSNATMLAATRRPDVFAAIGLWEPPIIWVDWWLRSTKDYHATVAASDDPAGSVETMYRRILGHKRWNALPHEVQEQRRAEGAAFQVDMASVMAAPFSFDQVRVPAVVGYGTATSPHHAYGAAWLAEQLPDAGLHAVPDAGHFAHRTDPGGFARFVDAAVARADDRAPTARPSDAP